MRRIWTFVLGIIVGGCLIFGAMNYHLVHAKDGFHVVPKVDAGLALTYADIRNFTVADWARNSELAAALMNANRRELVDSAIGSSLDNSLDKWLDRETR
jgi:hypothetical protein